MWADLDYDRRMGQTRSIMFFVIFVTHPKSHIETTDRRDFGGKPSKWRYQNRYVVKIQELCSVGGARSKKQHFPRIRVPFDNPAHSLQETVLPKPMVQLESRDSGGVRFASLEGAEKWSRDHHEN